jgi:polysaccharide export outer membrane protein
MLSLVLALLAAVPAYAVDGTYTLNAGDVLQITVWKEDGLDRETLVLPDGSISFPLVGSIVAQGKTAVEVQDEIAKKIERYVRDASITVTVKAALGNFVDVVGQVNKAGEITLGHPTTVMQALAMAGGLTPYASHHVRVLRHERSGAVKAIEFPYDDVADGSALDKDIYLLPGDVVVVPTAGLL